MTKEAETSTTNPVVKTLRHQYNCPVWVDLEGNCIPLVTMNQQRLLNCQRFVEHKLATLTEPYSYSEPQGEMAQDLYWSDMNRAINEYHKRRCTLLYWQRELAKEINRRTTR